MTDRRHDPDRAERRQRNAPAFSSRYRSVDRNIIELSKAPASCQAARQNHCHAPIERTDATTSSQQRREVNMPEIIR